VEVVLEAREHNGSTQEIPTICELENDGKWPFSSMIDYNYVENWDF